MIHFWHVQEFSGDSHCEVTNNSVRISVNSKHYSPMINVLLEFCFLCSKYELLTRELTKIYAFVNYEIEFFKSFSCKIALR